MNPLVHAFASEGWTTFVQSLLHTLWIGAVAAIGLFVALRQVNAPAARYRWSIAALVSVLLGGLIAWSILQQKTTPPVTASASTVAGNQSLSTNRDFANEDVSAALPNGSDMPVSHGTVLSFQVWRPWIALAWIIGTAFMLGRTLWLVGNAERVRRSSMPLENQTLLEFIDRAQQELALAKRIQVAVTQELTSPAVLGVFVPMLVLPLSLVTTLPMNQLQLIILHELAHIRRGDYFVNLCQLLAESILFFNPAVWWISRQIRQEREACCDAMAIALAGGRAEYARALVQIAEEVLGTIPAAAVAFGGDHKRSSLRDRISRLLVPGYKPTVHLTRRGVMMWFVLGAAFLFLSAMGTRWTINAAAHLLTPQQRIEHIERKTTTYGKPPTAQTNSDDEKKIKVQAKVRMKDGSPLPSEVSGVFESVQPQYSYGAGAYRDKNMFSADVPPGDLYFIASGKDVAPAYIGPINIRGKTEVTNLELQMDFGFPISIEVVDEKSGAPLNGASVSALFWMPADRSCGNTVKVTTDARGVAIFPHAAPLKVRMTFEHEGYETFLKEFPPASPTERWHVSLRRGQPTTGIVLDQETGQPIAGATWHVLSSEGANPVEAHGLTTSSPALATTDAEGRFSITQLRRDLSYSLAVKAPKHASQIFYDVHVGRTLRVELGPELIVHGKIIGDMAQVKKALMNDKNFWFNWSYYIRRNSMQGMISQGAVEFKETAAFFQLTNPIAGQVKIHLDDHDFVRKIDRPTDDWEIDLSAASLATHTNKLRKVMLRFERPSGVAPKGTVFADLPGAEPHTAERKEFQITNGIVEFETPVGSSFSYESAKTIGYWFPPKYSIAVPDEPGPLVLTVPVVPAGAIYAQAKDGKGTILRDAIFSVRETKKSPLTTDTNPFSHTGDNYSQNREGDKYIASPLPLGGEYDVIAHIGNNFVVSPTIRITEEKPDQDVDLVFQPGRTMEGRVLSPDGKPLRGATVGLNWHLSSGGWALSPTLTDEAGKFHFDNCAPSSGEFRLDISSPGLRATWADVNWKKLPLEIQLSEGVKLAGQVIEAKSGLPIIDAEVHVFPSNGKAPDARVNTDDEGRFEFTTLTDTEYHLFVSGVNYSDQRSHTFRAGSKEPLRLEMVAPEGSHVRLGARK